MNKSAQKTVVNLRLLAERPELGVDYTWTERDSWLADFLDQDMKDNRKHGQAANFKANLKRENSTVFLQGDVEIDLTPVCGRCGKAFTHHHQNHFSLTFFLPGVGANLTSDSSQDPSDRETEWGQSDPGPVKEDVSSVVLMGDEVDLAHYFKEQVFLSLPMTFLCKPDCPGLCTRCGADLALQTCNCQEEPFDDRWQALKALKK